MYVYVYIVRVFNVARLYYTFSYIIHETRLRTFMQIQISVKIIEESRS